LTDMDFHKTPEIEGKIQTEVTFFLMQLFLFTYRSQQNLHFCGGWGSSENYEFWGISLHYKESYHQKILFFCWCYLLHGCC